MKSFFLILSLFAFSFVQAEDHAPTPAHASPSKVAAKAAHSESPSVSPDKALTWLKNGNSRFTKGQWRHDGQSKKDIHRLADGQHPHAIVLSCSDSRVPPELVFDQKLGEIFTVRTAGESLDNNAVGSIEYALEHLGSRLIVVLGHTSCGAVKAALETMDGKDAGSPALNSLVKGLHPHLMSFKDQPRSKGVAAEGMANAQGVADDLVASSEIVRKRLKSGDLKIVPALYHLDSGHVEFVVDKVNTRKAASHPAEHSH